MKTSSRLVSIFSTRSPLSRGRLLDRALEQGGIGSADMQHIAEGDGLLDAGLAAAALSCNCDKVIAMDRPAAECWLAVTSAAEPCASSLP